MAFTAENVEKAVQQFYSDAINQQEINKWLMTAQTSSQAWQYCWKLLDNNKTPEVQFFGASSLHIKIARFWHEVPTDQVPTLRKSLFEELIKYAKGPKMVLTRLCVVLSSFTLQTVPDTWTNPVNDIITTFQESQHGPLETSQACQVLLEILTVLPEEFISSQFSPQKKGLVKHELQKGVSQVLSLLQMCLTASSPPAVYTHALRCFSSWVQFGVSLNEVEPLIDSVFEAVRQDQYFDTAVDALVNLFSHPDSLRYPRTIQRMLGQILSLQPLLQKAVEDHDMDQCQGMCKLIVCAAEQNTQLLLTLTLGDHLQRQVALNIVNMVLQCTSLPGNFPVDESCTNLSFGFWYNFQDDIIVADSEKYQALIQVYTPVYMDLVQVLLKKGQYPSESEYSGWNTDEKEDHRCYRQDIADTLMYAYNLLHNILLGNLCQLLAAALDRSAAGPVKWQEVESVLFAMTSIAESVDQDENTFLPALFTMLSRVPCDNYKVVSQALYLIGSYAEWISSHPEVLSHVIPLMLQGVTDTELAQPATLSLKEVVRENQDHLRPFVQPILTASQEALESGKLKCRDTVRLMACLGYVLSVLPVEDAMSYLNILLSPHIRCLQELAQTEPSAMTKSGIQLRLQMMSWLFGSLHTGGDDSINEDTSHDQPQPVLLVLEQVLPVLHDVLQKWITDAGVVENVCDMIKRALRTLMNDKVPIITDIAQLVMEMYQVAPQAAMLDLAKQVLILCASERQYDTAGQMLFDTICRTTVNLIQANPREHPDVFEGFMVLLAQICKKNKQLYEKSTVDLGGLFDSGVIGLCMHEPHTVKASCHFLNELIAAGESLQIVKAVVQNKGDQLVDRLIRSISGESPRTVIDSMSDLLLALNKQHFDHLCKWMNELISQEGYPNPRISRETKEQFARRVIMERINRRKMRETVQEYTLLWRGLLGTEYAAQTINILQAPV